MYEGVYSLDLCVSNEIKKTFFTGDCQSPEHFTLKLMPSVCNVMYVPDHLNSFTKKHAVPRLLVVTNCYDQNLAGKNVLTRNST